MSMGAIAAMEAAGKTPGKDLMIASIDGTKDAAQAVADGKIAVLGECEPHFGPKAFRPSRITPTARRSRCRSSIRTAVHEGAISQASMPEAF